MFRRIKSIFVREKWLSNNQAATLRRLPLDERLAHLGGILHDICVRKAARFVEEDHRRADSPFKDLPRSDLFHELLVLNFWTLESLFKGRRQKVMECLYRHYHSSFVWGLGATRKELPDSMRGKFLIYDETWDDYSGHQDAFARQTIGIIFGDRQIPGAAQAAFWLISYADRSRKDFTAIRKSMDRFLKEDAGYRW